MSLFGLSGTRWITHKLNALQLMLDKFGIYLQHLQSMSEDKSFKSADRQKFKGWLRKWQQARIPLLACLFLEILSPAKMLSLASKKTTSTQSLPSSTWRRQKNSWIVLKVRSSMSSQRFSYFWTKSSQTSPFQTSMLPRILPKYQKAYCWTESKMPRRQGWRLEKTRSC